MAFLRGNGPSATAQRVAMRRAAHQLLDKPKVFDDPVALRIIGKEGASALQADPHQFEATPQGELFGRGKGDSSMER